MFKKVTVNCEKFLNAQVEATNRSTILASEKVRNTGLPFARLEQTRQLASTITDLAMEQIGLTAQPCGVCTEKSPVCPFEIIIDPASVDYVALVDVAIQNTQALYNNK